MTANKFIALLLALVAIYLASPVLIPLTLALFLALLLEPFVAFAMRRGFSRAWASSTVVIAFGVFAWGGLWLTLRLIDPLTLEVSAYSARIQDFWDTLRHWLVQRGYVAALPNSLPDLDFHTWSPVLIRGMNSLSELLALVVFVPLMTAYLLIDKANLKESLNTIVGKYLFIPSIDYELPRVTRAFFFGNFVGGLTLSILQSLLLFSLGYRNPISLGFLSGFLNVIPLVGLPLAVALPLAQGLLQFNHWSPFIVVAGAWSVLHFVMGNILFPRLIGARVNVNSAALLLGLLFWGWLWGFTGFLLAIPLTTLLKVLLESHSGTRHIANLLAARPQYVRRGPFEMEWLMSSEPRNRKNHTHI